MATRTTRSQTRTIGTAPSVAPSPSPRYNLLNALGSNRQGPKLVDQFQSFSTHCTMPSASQPSPSQESPTPGAHIMVIPDYDGSENSAGLLFGGPVLYDDDDAGDPDFPGGDPSDPPSDDDLDFPAEDLYPNDSDKETEVEHVPSDMLIQLASAIQSLARSSCHPSSDPTPCTKVREPDQFDGTDSRKLQVFLVQLELNFQDCAKAFRMGCAKVTFVQSYLKGMALEWFEPDLLLAEDPAL